MQLLCKQHEKNAEMGMNMNEIPECIRWSERIECANECVRSGFPSLSVTGGLIHRENSACFHIISIGRCLSPIYRPQMNRPNVCKVFTNLCLLKKMENVAVQGTTGFYIFSFDRFLK